MYFYHYTKPMSPLPQYVKYIPAPPKKRIIKEDISMKPVLDFIWALFHPSFWFMKNPYSKALDKRLNRALENKLPMETSKFKNDVKFDNLTLGVYNFPYSYMQTSTFRPARRTIKKLFNYYQELEFSKEK